MLDFIAIWYLDKNVIAIGLWYHDIFIVSKVLYNDTYRY
jgi:hypothetical protein